MVAEDMSKSVSEASDEFEFVETPAAPTPTPVAENYGVRTTSVSQYRAVSALRTVTPK